MQAHFLGFRDFILIGQLERCQKTEQEGGGDDMQQRTAGRTQNLGRAARTQPLYMGCALYKLTN